jgi:myo-inositol-1(or 4)-monophosphatase
MLRKPEQRAYLARIERALQSANEAVHQFVPGTFTVRDTGGRDVMTEVDRRVSDVLRAILPKPGEGWLSEEDPDDPARLACDVVWIVDPLDGTREFVDGIPEWCISVGLVVKGVAVAGGICNPATNELFLGSSDLGVTYNGKTVRAREVTDMTGAVVLASRQECKRGEWTQFEQSQFTVRPMGSVAYKLALVAAGLAEATWTLSPKHEWDVAGGVALVTAAGGHAAFLDDSGLSFNRSDTLLPGLIASGAGVWPKIMQLLVGARRRS